MADEPRESGPSRSPPSWPGSNPVELPESPGFHRYFRFDGLLPQEMLERIVLFLDPESARSFMATSAGLGRRLTAATDAFWQDYASEWRIPLPPPGLFPEEGLSLCGRIAKLQENWSNISEDRSKIYRCDLGSLDLQPRLTEENGKAISQHKILTPEPTRTMLNPHLEFNGRFAALTSEKPYQPILVWETGGPNVAEPSKIQLPMTEDVVTPATLCIWRNFVMFTPEMKRDRKSPNLILLKIYNLDAKATTFTTVRVPRQGCCDHRVLGFAEVIESVSGSGKAVVAHTFQPMTIFVVGVPGGVLERRIALADSRCEDIIVMRSRPQLSPSVVVKFEMDGRCAKYLIVTAVGAEETAAKMVHTHNEYMNVAVTRAGDMIAVVKESVQDIDEISLVLINQGMLGTVEEEDLDDDDDENWVDLDDDDDEYLLKPQEQTFKIGKFGAHVHADEPDPDAQLMLQPANTPWQSTMSVSEDLSVAVVHFEWEEMSCRTFEGGMVTVEMRPGAREKNGFFGARFEFGAKPGLQLLYEVTTGLAVRESCVFFDRFLTVSAEADASKLLLSFYDVGTGKVRAKKVVQYKKEGGKKAFSSWCHMTLSDVILLFEEEDDVDGFCIVKY